jgi:hypothetical protein
MGDTARGRYIGVGNVGTPAQALIVRILKINAITVDFNFIQIHVAFTGQ